MDSSLAPVAPKAYVTWVSDGERWSAHVERSEDDPTGESSEHDTAAGAVAWARERTDWVLVDVVLILVGLWMISRGWTDLGEIVVGISVLGLVVSVVQLVRLRRQRPSDG